MASAESPDLVVFSAVLDRLECLPADKYIVAFGPYGRQFCATPNGYSGTQIPMDFFTAISIGYVKMILWASFGTEPESWFLAYKTNDGTSAFRLGKDAPVALYELVQRLNKPNNRLSSLRVQLGDGESFVLWSQKAWACSNVPQLLQVKLCQLSSTFREYNSVMKGSLKQGTLDNVQWHRDGTFYMKSGKFHVWHYHADIMRAAWHELWRDTGYKRLDSKLENELAYVAIDPHSNVGETFVFLKKQQPGKEAIFVIHFGQECLHTNLRSSDDVHQPDLSVQFVAQEPDVPFQWATSLKSGRPHPKDSWELELMKGERVKVLRDMGRDWLIVLGRKNIKGWVHRSWLDFGDCKLHKNPKSAYKQFQEDLQKLLVPGHMCSFPRMALYIDVCSKRQCQAFKEDVSSLGICVHDLNVLLNGSDRYSYEWLKEERNVWHPDRFARFCQPEHTERLKPMAEQMFVFYGILMDACEA
ncbi:hypothetical protein BKA66DRAFT_529275 [Pyrenochaeta sp. MPI-SDFR-AT-0127]|nr:hypothetical protein BKA66DRAFT_529275 [Pyrenochaeta sp. MPI-SDFR-AT-0127]